MTLDRTGVPVIAVFWPALSLVGLAVILSLALNMAAGLMYPSEASNYPTCLARCEALMDHDHRPAGWVVLDPDPCTCGVVLEAPRGE